MKAIRIDVVNKDVYEVEMNPGIDDIYTHLECETFTLPIILENSDGLYVDDEALLKEPEDQYGAFMFSDYPFQPLFGHGLIVGCDHKGEQTDVKSDIESIKSKIVFLNFEDISQEVEKLLNKGFEYYEI